MDTEKISILLVCPNSRHFIKEYIENVLESKSAELSVSFVTIDANLQDPFWEEKKIQIYNLKKSSESLLKVALLLPFRCMYIRKKLKHVDVIHYHFMDFRFTHLVDFFIGSIGKKTVLTWWGSDLLRRSRKIVCSFKKMMKKSCAINVMTKEMFDVLSGATKGKYDKKTIVLDFGDSTMDEMMRSLEVHSRADIKLRFNCPCEKVIIHLGYNGSSAQQHLKMIEFLSFCDVLVKEKILIMVPFSYGCCDKSYRFQLERALESSGISYQIYDSYLSKSDVADFRLTADIFLYGQTTDALSSSMIEYIAGGSLIIKPAWLVYSELECIQLINYEKFCDLTHIINDVVLNRGYEQIHALKNRCIVHDLKSWDNLRTKWLELYRI